MSGNWAESQGEDDEERVKNEDKDEEGNEDENADPQEDKAMRRVKRTSLKFVLLLLPPSKSPQNLQND